LRLKVNTVDFQLPTPNSQQRTLGWLVLGNWKLGIGSFAKPTVVIALACFAVACRQDMHDAPRYEALEASTFFENGGSARTLVPNTVPRGYLREDELLNTGKLSGQFANTFPMAVTADVMARGRERYNVFCSPCHGQTGVGNGMIVQRGFRQPPSYGEQRLREAPAGYFFDVMTNGFGAMQDYAAQVPVADRWAIVAYIRALQLSMNATVADVPADRRSDLDRPAQENQ
jgi:mono/diheme cytochrome c family protein